MINRTKQPFWGVASDIFWQCVLLKATFAAIPIILHFFSKSLYGPWIALLSILGYLEMLDLGFGISLSPILWHVYPINQMKDLLIKHSVLLFIFSVEQGYSFCLLVWGCHRMFLNGLIFLQVTRQALSYSYRHNSLCASIAGVNLQRNNRRLTAYGSYYDNRKFCKPYWNSVFNCLAV